MPLFSKKSDQQDIELAHESWWDAQTKAITQEYGKVLHKDAIDQLIDNFLPGEEIELVIPGTSDSAIIVTQHRVFVYKRGGAGGVMGGSKFVSWDPDEIHGVQFEFGKISGLVAILTPSAPATDMSYWDTSGSAPQKLPNAIAIGSKDAAYEATIRLRRYLFNRKYPQIAETMEWE